MSFKLKLVAYFLLVSLLPLGAAASGNAASAPRPFTSGEAGTTSGGYPLGGAGPAGITIRFIDGGSFWVAVLLVIGVSIFFAVVIWHEIHRLFGL